MPEAGSGPDQLVMFVVPSASGIVDVEEVQKRCQRAIRNDINPLFKLQKVNLCPHCLANVMRHSPADTCHEQKGGLPIHMSSGS